ncbi:Cyanovirin-N [Xylaria cubensis]|nr:Cyanovirin-N [Xylaria cubensis]
MGGFAITTRNHDLNRSLLQCEAQRRSGNWAYASIDLNNYLENNDGTFQLSGRNAWETSETSSWRLDGVTLSARLRRRNGAFNNASIDLNPYITNNDGTLQWIVKS